VLALLMACAPALVAQQREGDEAWSHGRLDEARAAYERVLATDSTAFHANLRVGLMLAWKGKQDSALVLIARARRSEPKDVEARLIEAKVMAWDGRYLDAIARYDSLLAEQPELSEAELGRARARAWRGDLGQAARGYRAVLESEPRNADALVGLGYVYHWQGREGPAERYALAALEADSTHQAGRDLFNAVRSVTRASLEPSANWTNDSDHNTSFLETLGASAPMGSGVRIFGNVAALETSDRVRSSSDVGGEAGLSWSIGELQLSAAGGARQLSPDTAAARTAETYRGQVRWRPTPRFGASVGYWRSPFDEIASLTERGLNLESLEAGVDGKLTRGLSVVGAGGRVWFSDGNRRTNVSAGITQAVGSFFVGVYGRAQSHERRGLGYFSPDRFHLLEGVAGYNLARGSWDGRLSGGLGAQQIGRGGVAQSEWHLEARLGRRWGVGNRLDVFGTVTNSAVSSTSGAFRYRTAGVSMRLGL
jgi:tetratricopeptide (TPR) repeat protein